VRRMSGFEWMLEGVLVTLLAATLFYAVRLERALGMLKRDRTELEALISSFNASTRHAEEGIERLQTAADNAGMRIARQAETAVQLKQDLGFLTERGERLADRLDHLIRKARPLIADARQMPSFTSGNEQTATEMPRVRSQAERDLLNVLRMAR